MTMKKFVVVLAVAAMSCIGAAAFAADVTVSGSLDIRSRDFTNTKADPSDFIGDNGTTRDTQERVRLTVDAKAGDDVKGRISVENDWDEWGRLEAPQGNGQSTTKDWGGNNGTGVAKPVQLDVREAWINFNVPGVPLNVNVGHQLLQLGNGWFLRNMKYGDDAWVVANVTGGNTAAFVDIKVSEGDAGKADDVDAYALLDVLKLNDALTVGADLSMVKDRKNAVGLAKNPIPSTATPETQLYNLGLNLNGKFGPLGIKAEADLQAGKAKDANLVTAPSLGGPSGDAKFKGNQVVLQGAFAMDPLTFNLGAGRGTGAKLNQNDYNQFVNFMDADQHYTFLYEYKVSTAAGKTHTGFANTTGLNLGAMVAAAKGLNVGVDLWYLQAVQAVALNKAVQADGTTPATSRKLGTEVDVKVNWQMYDNLSWNWTLGYFKPGEAYDSPATGPGTVVGQTVSADKVMGAQGVLTFKF
jgi:hypothetical protein